MQHLSQERHLLAHNGHCLLNLPPVRCYQIVLLLQDPASNLSCWNSPSYLSSQQPGRGQNELQGFSASLMVHTTSGSWLFKHVH